MSKMINNVRQLIRSINYGIHPPQSSVDPSSIMTKEWDNLVLLTGCRYDTYKILNEIEPKRITGPLYSQFLRNSHTEEFLAQNFPDCYNDTVYVTANPHSLNVISQDTFYKTISLIEEFGPEYETVHPKAVTNRAAEIAETYSDKRLIIHYMQPYSPFIGLIGDSIDHQGHKNQIETPTDTFPLIWQQLRTGKIDIGVKQVQAAYIENLDITMVYLQKLLDSLTGRSVVTSVHGTFIGDRMTPIPVREFGAKRGLCSPELTQVPWQVIDADAQH